MKHKNRSMILLTAWRVLCLTLALLTICSCAPARHHSSDFLDSIHPGMRIDAVKSLIDPKDFSMFEEPTWQTQYPVTVVLTTNAMAARCLHYRPTASNWLSPFVGEPTKGDEEFYESNSGRIFFDTNGVVVAVAAGAKRTGRTRASCLSIHAVAHGWEALTGAHISSRFAIAGVTDVRTLMAWQGPTNLASDFSSAPHVVTVMVGKEPVRLLGFGIPPLFDPSEVKASETNLTLDLACGLGGGNWLSLLASGEGTMIEYGRGWAEYGPKGYIGSQTRRWTTTNDPQRVYVFRPYYEAGIQNRWGIWPDHFACFPPDTDDVFAKMVNNDPWYRRSRASNHVPEDTARKLADPQH